MLGKLVVFSSVVVVVTGCSAGIAENVALFRPGYGEVSYKGDAEFINSFGAYEVGKLEQAKATPDVKTGYMQLQEKLAGLKQRIMKVKPQGGK